MPQQTHEEIKSAAHAAQLARNAFVITMLGAFGFIFACLSVLF